MTKFLVCMKQSGEGCDYTIGCGMVYKFVMAESMDAAIEDVVWPDGRDEESSLESVDQALEEILVLPADFATKVDVDGIKRKMVADREAVEKDAAELSERMELNRLKEKYQGED